MAPTQAVPAAPEFGAPIDVGRGSPETLALLARRRSASAPLLEPPAPSPEELEILLRTAPRAPDQGKLSPWRFLIIAGDDRAALVRELERFAPAQPQPDKALAPLAKLRNPPLTV